MEESLVAAYAALDRVTLRRAEKEHLRKHALTALLAGQLQAKVLDRDGAVSIVNGTVYDDRVLDAQALDDKILETEVSDSLMGFSHVIMAAAEDIRLNVASAAGQPCATLHKAVGVLKGGGQLSQQGADVVKDLNLLNHACTALHHFDSAKLKSLTEQATLMANSISEGKVLDNSKVADGKAVRDLNGQHGNDGGTVSQGKFYEDKGAESEMAILRARIEALENAQVAEVESDGLISWWAHDAEDCKVVDPPVVATAADIAGGGNSYDGNDFEGGVLDGVGYADEQSDEASTNDTERDSEEEQQQGDGDKIDELWVRFSAARAKVTPGSETYVGKDDGCANLFHAAALLKELKGLGGIT
jgi:hypothetical protein